MTMERTHPPQTVTLTSEDGLGTVTVQWNPAMAYAGWFEVAPEAPPGTAARLLVRAIRVLSDAGATGVIIHTEGRNVTRRAYQRMGFRDIEELPGLKVAAMGNLVYWADRMASKG